MKRTTETSLTDQIIETSETPIEKREPECLDPECLIPTGSTLLNCACADNPWAGYGTGKMVNLIGDESAGKTLLALTMLAEVAHTKRLNKYRLIYDDAEEAIEFDLKYLFGSKFARRLEKLEQPSETVEDFRDNVILATNDGKPFIYVLDSYDALGTASEIKKAYKRAMAKAKTETQAKAIKEGFQSDKARMNTEIMRLAVNPLKESDSLLVVINQVREKIGVTFGSRKRRAGGKALGHYLTHEMWLAITKRYKSDKQEIGVHTEVKTTKNRLTGKRRVIHFPIYYDYGVDDIGANVDFLTEQGWWRGGGSSKINAVEFDVELMRRDLLRYIEKEQLQKPLKELVGEAWLEREQDLRIKREPRFP